MANLSSLILKNLDELRFMNERKENTKNDQGSFLIRLL
jgi:hypothetical protein